MRNRKYAFGLAASLVAIVLPVALHGCTPSGGTSGKNLTKNPLREALVKSAGVCTYALYQDFLASVGELTKATETLAASPTEENRKAAQSAWMKSIDLWQQAEVTQFGPAGVTTSPGGKNLRDPIYSWPLVSRCLVEQQLVSKTYESGGLATALVNTRGLDALEYLLFYSATDNACSTSSTINTSSAWAELNGDEISARKAAYAHAAAVDLATYARALVDAWAPEKGNFLEKMNTAAAGNDVFSSDQMALNALSDAMFYVESEVKDLKLGKPAGILGCVTATCPEALESRFAGHSKTHLRNNLLGFQRIFEGCSVPGGETGFEELLVDRGAGDLATAMKTDLNAAIAALDAIEEPTLEEALVKDLPSVVAAHAAIKKVTDELKTQFVTVLDLELPKRVEGDND